MAGIKISDLPAATSALLTDVFPVDQLPGPVTYKESNSQLLTLFKANGEALTRVNDTNVTMTLGGAPSTALFNATSMTMGWSGQLAVPRGGTGNSTFTAFSVICAGTTATGAFQNVVGVGNAGEQLTSNGAGLLPTWQTGTIITPSALTKVDDTNVTLTLGGTPATALLQAVSITAGWAGTLAETRGGTAQSTYTLGDILYSSASNTLSKLTGNITTTKQYLSQTGSGAVSAAPSWATIAGADITGAALTKVDDTNVTLTLGGTPTTALLRAASVTAGWAGQLSLARGGTNKNITADNGAIVYCDADSFELLASTATAGQIVRSGASSAPSWSTATYPSTAGTSGNVLTSNGTNFVSSAPTAFSSVVIQKFTASGTYTPTSGMKYCIIELVGGGGGGGGTVIASATSTYFGAGGGAGGYSRKTATAATIGASQVVTIGAGGTAGANTGAAGGNGGDTSVGSICIGKGGSGGAGSGATGSLTFGSAGAGGVAGTGDVTIVGNGGSKPAGFSTTSAAAIGPGVGGASFFGGAPIALSNYPGSATGIAGTTGSGGGGGVDVNASSARAGGAGGDGYVLITEYI